METSESDFVAIPIHVIKTNNEPKKQSDKHKENIKKIMINYMEKNHNDSQNYSDSNNVNLNIFNTFNHCKG